MTDINIHFKIIDEYKNFIQNKGLDIKLINYFIKEYDLDPCDSRTHLKAIENLKDKQKRFVIPKQIGEKKIPANPDESFVLIENNIKYKVEKLYENYTEKEAQEVAHNRFRIDDEIEYIIHLLNITELYSSKGTKQTTKIERDTRSKKNSFINSYLKSAKEHKMKANKTIAELTKISNPTASRLLKNIDILEKLNNELKDLIENNYDVLNELENEDERKTFQISKLKQSMENIEDNQRNIQERIDKIEREKKIKQHIELSKKGM